MMRDQKVTVNEMFNNEDDDLENSHIDELLAE
jgi:hypothetical protein